VVQRASLGLSQSRVLVWRHPPRPLSMACPASAGRLLKLLQATFSGHVRTGADAGAEKRNGSEFAVNT
jgi:hypothetical protein